MKFKVFQDQKKYLVFDHDDPLLLDFVHDPAELAQILNLAMYVI